MENTTRISIEELAVKLNGKMWVKDELKRIYLDRGYNTKKMSTKTYVFEKEGKFIVSCEIDCPSQNYNWIDSQEEQVKESVYQQIEEIIELSKIELVEARLTSDETEVEVRISYNGNEEVEFLSETKFDERFNQYPQSVFENLPKTKTQIHNEFKADLKRKLTGKSEFEKKNIAFEAMKQTTDIELKKYCEDMFAYYAEISKEGIENANIDLPQIKEVSILGSGKKVKHPRFGVGEIIAETDEKATVLFQECGEKILLKSFANFTYLND